MKLTTENRMIDIPDLNRFKIGDEVICDATADYDRFEGVIIGLELHRTFPCCGELKPSITLLHDGYITDGFTPNDLRPAGRAALALEAGK
ncbi:hypothetical protein K1X45_15815 [Pseudochrobactrum sp. Wa41.01b-1]|uniref:hypothetical protein n=1 Tax=Pseudochrobactrum sp. Wa41.01b-1 TaxID=2864102 RepID=UPI001C68C9D6|nr:hypothetical protein [Pseudochrobactrum sp. Wa41.01b-1]QYM72874.1 hypothetical protein K1X45_15815 [Pseudochrobactrum sp. Wa41.01b-1]